MRNKKNKKEQAMDATVSGLGVDKAIQEAVDADKELVVVRKYSQRTGRIINMAYFLAEKGKPIPTDWRTKIVLFKRDEVTIIYNRPSQKPMKAGLGVSYTPPERLIKKGREYLIFLSLDLTGMGLRLRNVFNFRRQGIISFVVQLEANIKGGSMNWKAVIRYDCAHGYIHRDLIYSDGRKEQEKIGSQQHDEAVKIAIADMSNNFKYWLHRLGYDELSSLLPSERRVKEELQKAEEFLLDLIKHPKKITKTSSKLIQLYYHNIEVMLP